MAAEILEKIELNEERFLSLLEKLIGETEFLQNNPPGLIPEEDRACKHVLDCLNPFTKENGGPLTVSKETFVEKRSNIMDVVPANPEGWDRNPFELVIEGEKLYGRGTTDCLGHVAVITTLFSQLAELKPELNVNVNAVFIASEEASGPGVGVDALMASGKMDHLKNGPIIWIDCADSQPCVGTASAITWHIKGINALELAMDAVNYIQQEFYKDIPPHPDEKVYNFASSSTMKPTQMSCPKGGLNQLPPHTTISGDIRLTPFYKNAEAKAAVEKAVAAINADPTILGGRGPHSRYVLPDQDLKGRLELTWGDHEMTGIACKLDSPGFTALCEATKEVVGKADPYAICGSLPLVADLKEAGYDIQLTGYGLTSTYHADNEYCELGDMRNAAKILSRIIKKLHEQ